MLRGTGHAASVAERQRDRAQMMLDAYPRAVDILVRIKGMSEPAALEKVYAWLVGL